ncbi:chaplin [Streptomyces sp. NPDC017943]|uniref:chaplin n=1 Tax=Streptomyces sp. NPDC017943 TaxID=3365019 RepID=UPI00379C3B94
MKRVTRNGMIAVAAASGAMAMTAPAYAGAGADGAAAGSPGLVSGNTVQLPVRVPVNACGNTVNVVGLLNPAAGNACANVDEGHHGPKGAVAGSTAKDSPGVISGNGVHLPVDLPVNVTGNSVNVVGVGNPATGNTSVNTPDRPPARPDRPRPPKPEPEPEPPTRPRTLPAPAPVPHAAPHTRAALAHTGTDHALQTVAASAALLAGGVLLRRRFRPGSER